MKSIQVLGGGAVAGLVAALTEPFGRQSGAAVTGEFGAVGAMKTLFLQNTPCDLLILTQALMEELANTGHVIPSSITAVGYVPTGVAVRTGDPVPRIETREAFRQTLRQADEIYVPDLTRSTAGIHFARVLESLDIAVEVKASIRQYPNGKTAMEHLSRSTAGTAIGCTQCTEILYTEGVTLAGPFPDEFKLSTLYSAGICTHAAAPEAAAQFLAMLTAPEQAPLRQSSGFQ